MTQTCNSARALARWLRAAALLLVAGALIHGAVAATLSVGLLGLEDDARYQPRRLELGYPGQPSGRPLDAATMALAESASELQASGQQLQLKSVLARSAAELPQALAALKAAHVQHVLLDLPEAEIRAVLASAPAALGPALFFNIGSGADALRGAGCAANLLHTYPSEAMRADALAQYLAARSWTQALVLVGPDPQDALLQQAFARAARRYGITMARSLSFKRSSDPREREQANVRLLSNERAADVVVVQDSDGAFARSVPYNTQWPRPVLGSSGLVALAWHPQWERNGGPQLSRRFARAAHRPMTGQDWAAWAAIKSIVGVLVLQPKATLPEQIALLRHGEVYIDGFKGPRLSYRSWDGQLRQPLFLAHGDGVAAQAPFEGVLHPTEVLDTLGVDEKESPCKSRP